MFMLSFLANTLKWQIPLFLSENFLTGFDEKETNWTTLVGGMKEWHVKYDSVLSWVITWLEFGASLTRTRKVITEPFHNGIGGRWGSRRKDMANACSLIHRPSVMTVSIKSRCLSAKVNQSLPISCCISAQIGFPLWHHSNRRIICEILETWQHCMVIRTVVACCSIMWSVLRKEMVAASLPYASQRTLRKYSVQVTSLCVMIVSYIIHNLYPSKHNYI